MIGQMTLLVVLKLEKSLGKILSSGLTNIVRIFKNQVQRFRIGTIKGLVGREMMVY